jgi:anaerobic nitric oxide reductase transcription regulator
MSRSEDTAFYIPDINDHLLYLMFKKALTPSLAGYFVEQTRQKLGIAQLKITPSAINHLDQYNWPGNVRELEHVISRAALKARARQRTKAIVSIDKVDCGSLVTLGSASVEATATATATKGEPSLVADSRINLALKAETENFQRQLISTILKEEGGNWAATARRLSTDRANLNRIAKRLNIKVVKNVECNLDP